MSGDFGDFSKVLGKLLLMRTSLGSYPFHHQQVDVPSNPGREGKLLVFFDPPRTSTPSYLTPLSGVMSLFSPHYQALESFPFFLHRRLSLPTMSSTPRLFGDKSKILGPCFQRASQRPQVDKAFPIFRRLIVPNQFTSDSCNSLFAKRDFR